MPSFSIGAVFSRFFTLLGGNAPLFIVIALVCNVLPTLAVTYATITYLHMTVWSERFSHITEANFAYIIGGAIILGLLNLAVISMITEVAIVRAVNKPVKPGAAIGNAFFNILPLCCVTLLTGLIVGGGFILFVIPGIIWLLCTWVAVPAYVGQPGLGIWGAIMKSFALTRNHRWQLLLIGFIGLVMLGLLQSAIGAIGLLFVGTDKLALPSQLVQTALSAALDVPTYVFTAAVYVALRESKDKQTPTQTAEVFG